MDGVQNGDEVDVDCGGERCLKCKLGALCQISSDCRSGFCDPAETACAPLHCGSGVMDGDETDVDCGGPSCAARCPLSAQCATNADCASGFCSTDGKCLPAIEIERLQYLAPASCSDGKLSDGETDVDCGGDSCIPCPAFSRCSRDADCADGGKCGDDRVCRAAHCSDGARDHREADTDCGGADCAGCAFGQSCAVDGDCASKRCDLSTSLCLESTCNDGLQNGAETDVDCGGSGCKPCARNALCFENADCASGFCDSRRGSVCRPASCGNGMQDADEADVDCGGESCGSCASLMACERHADCDTKFCLDSVCREMSCGDGIRDLDESDIDCGGPNCAKCALRARCFDHNDCTSGFCDPKDNRCRALECGDGTQNGRETDVDCGGDDCVACELGSSCEGNEDCASITCVDATCVAHSCTNGVQDGEETGMDCGGPFCVPCGNGHGCEADEDCASSYCDAILGSCAVRPSPADSIIDCDGRTLFNDNCKSAGKGYQTCSQHFSDDVCDDGFFTSDDGTVLNFNCPKFNCDNFACGACRDEQGLPAVSGVDREWLHNMSITSAFAADWRRDHVVSQYVLLFRVLWLLRPDRRLEPCKRKLCEHEQCPRVRRRKASSLSRQRAFPGRSRLALRPH